MAGGADSPLWIRRSNWRGAASEDVASNAPGFGDEAGFSAESIVKKWDGAEPVPPWEKQDNSRAL